MSERQQLAFRSLSEAAVDNRYGTRRNSDALRAALQAPTPASSSFPGDIIQSQTQSQGNVHISHVSSSGEACALNANPKPWVKSCTTAGREYHCCVRRVCIQPPLFMPEPIMLEHLFVLPTYIPEPCFMSRFWSMGLNHAEQSVLAVDILENCCMAEAGLVYFLWGD